METSEVTKEEIEKLKKGINTKAKIENYYVFRLDYDKSLIIPFAQAETLMKALNNAEMYIESYSEGESIRPLKHSDLITYIISEQEYRNIKVANLLGIKKSELEKKLNDKPD